MRRAYLVAVGLMGLGLAAAPARAYLIDGTYTFNATFPTSNGAPPSISGTATLSFDTSTIGSGTYNFSAYTSSLPVSSAVYQYEPDLGGGVLTLEFNYTNGDNSNIFLSFNPGSTSASPDGSSGLYITSRLSVGTTSSSTTVSFAPAAPAPAPASVPEPGSLALLGAGLAGAVAARRRKRAR